MCRAAVEAGADAVGFVFAPSRRRVAIEEAKELARFVPDHVMKVGVFVDAEREELERTFREVPLDFIQYHGGESPDFIKSVGLPSIKAISVHGSEDVEKGNAYRTEYVLFDTPGIEFRGGSGKVFDWGLVDEGCAAGANDSCGRAKCTKRQGSNSASTSIYGGRVEWRGN